MLQDSLTDHIEEESQQLEQPAGSATYWGDNSHNLEYADEEPTVELGQFIPEQPLQIEVVEQAQYNPIDLRQHSQYNPMDLRQHSLYQLPAQTPACEVRTEC